MSASKLYSFPAIICDGKYFVQPFHLCSPEEKVYSNISYYQCTNGLTVHYTFVCDGHDTCLDNSDETMCDVSEKALDGYDVFRCRGTSQIIPQAQRCDGKPDCFLGSDEQKCTRCASGSFPFSFAKLVI